MNDPSPAHPGRTSSLAHLLALVRDRSYKRARVLNKLYALELGATPLDAHLLLATYGLRPLILAVYAGAPVWWVISAVLGAGAYTTRKRGG
jgi:hypothetical protein